MPILNVVQPEEFDPSSFTLIDDKLHVAISAKENNILQYKNDGLYAPTAGGGGVLERYVYNPDSTGKLVHKNVEFNFALIDGAIIAEVYGTNTSTQFRSGDARYSTNNVQLAMSDDSKNYLTLNWGAEYLRRSILKFHHNGEIAIWVIRVIRPFDKNDDDLNRLVVVIDEMVNTGDLSGEPSGDIVYPELTESTTLKHVGVLPTDGGSAKLMLSLFDNDCFAIVKLDAGGQPVIDSPTNLTGRLSAPHDVDNLNKYLSYCPNSGAVIYRHHDGIEAIVDGERIGLNLPLSNEGNVTIGVNIGVGDVGGMFLFFYTFSTEGLYYQTLGEDGLSEQKWIAYPNIEVKDYVVSGATAHYLGVENGNYVLISINLISNKVSSRVSLDFVDPNATVSLIPTVMGGVLIHLIQNGLQFIIPFLPKQNVESGSVELNLGEPTILEGELIKLDRIHNAGFVISDDITFKFFLNGSSLSLNRLTTDFATGGLSIVEAPIPTDYMEALMGDRPVIPLTYNPNTVCYDKSPSGKVLTYAPLTLSEVSKAYQSEALIKFNNSLAVLATDITGGLGLFRVDDANVIDTSVDLLPVESGVTIVGFVKISHSLGVAVWKSKEGKTVFARFSATTDDIIFTELGDSRSSNSSVEISQDSTGNYLVKETLNNDGLEIIVWSISPEGIVETYNHADVNEVGTTLIGTTLLGDKLLVLGYVGNTTNIRVLDARTGVTLIKGNVAIGKDFSNQVFQEVDHETLAIIENGGSGNSDPERIAVRLLKVTATEVTLIKKSILDLTHWQTLNGHTMTSLTYQASEGTISYQSAMREGKRYYVKIQATATDFKVYEQEVTNDIVTKAGVLVRGGPAPRPMITFFNEDVGYLQHNPKLSSFNTFTLDMVEHDNSPKPKTFTAAWSKSNGQILLNGQMANAYTDNWTYIRLEVDTPSGETHETKGRIGSNMNGVFSDNLWIISEPGEYVFRVSNWDGGPVMEARATVPSVGLDFTPPTVTSDGDGSWTLTTTNASAMGRGVYGIYRSRSPISILDDYYNGSRYITDDALGVDPMLMRFTIPASERNGTWYIMVGHQGSLPGDVWTPTFLTYTA